MKRNHTCSPLVLLPFIVAIGGCPNPADNAPKAKVGESPSKAEPAAGADPAAASQPAGAEAAGSAPAAGAEIVEIAGEGSSIGFVGSKVTGKHDGGFKSFSGKIHLDAANLTASKVMVEIDMSSVFSDTEKLTGHLKSPDFFDVEKFPKAKFSITEIKADADGKKHTLTGDLDLHGIKKAISFPAMITVTDAEVTATSEFSLNRKDFGIVYPGKPDDLIRDDVLIKLDLKAKRKKG